MTKEVGVLLQKRCSSLACRLKEKEKKIIKFGLRGRTKSWNKNQNRRSLLET